MHRHSAVTRAFDCSVLAVAVLGAYVVLGGPAPLGTLSVGTPCFLLFWMCLWRFLISPEGISTQQHKAGRRLIICFAAWVGQLVSYAIITIVLHVSDSDEFTELLAVGFAVVNGCIMKIDIRGFIFDGGRPGGGTKFPSHDQWLAARLFPLMFICLHLTYFNFLFPVLAEGPAVVFGAIATVLVNAQAPDFSAAMVPDEVAEAIYARYILLIASTVCPVLFGLLLSFDHWGWNAEMFFVLSDLCDDDVWKALTGCFINWLASAVSIAVFASTVMKRLREVDASMRVDQATGRISGRVEESYCVVRAVWISWHWLELTLQNEVAILTAEQQQELESIEETDDKEIQTIGTGSSIRGSISTSVATATAGHRSHRNASRLKRGNTMVDMNSIERGAQRGLLTLLGMTFASMTTIVGVCMLMKHDGMDLEGWAAVLTKGHEPRYPLCPLLGDCFAYNASSLVHRCP